MQCNTRGRHMPHSLPLILTLCSWAVRARDLAVSPLCPELLTRGKAPEQRVPEACAPCRTMLTALYLPRRLVLSYAETALQATVPSLP